ncbi:hypothetical protein SUGI_1064100 [Cryptomeria japonica]|uniref:subtilisin-like protease SBT1.5 n=1 Tax=Cryptomeria japonica TaxID=3369 RepID=UPI0024149DFE|nr:subtilisin-like protease SBT1.5 [Cryptomeria japonica]XP_059068608.1 subtilisin-like protease SBT1.5 [Cryptomeria japonica]GLJ50024.1 hypothetical protein SUGI_1064050 [Cryptomeria japonica]GLJ50026.1 hypothetical protein SUGI_1064100 [Cryptomeria japonica]
MDVRSVSFVLLALFMAGYVLGVEYMEPSSVYIVHMDKSAMPREFPTHVHWYTWILSSVKGVKDQQNIEEEDLYLYTYDTVMHGFSAMLTQSQLDMLEEMPGHLSSFPDSLATMDTTHSTEFLELSPEKGILPESRFGQDIIVGMLDTGIWPESQSFHDDGMGPVPARWKGICQNGTDFDSSLCNKKLIGARYFNKGLMAMSGKLSLDADYDSPRDFEGHGSHTSSTAGGNYVEDVDFYGYAPGKARGVAPAARVAMYKVIWINGSTGSDALAAMETAISDGVDVMSMSFGYLSPPYFQDAIAIGALAAIKKGVVVVCSAGNSGQRGIMHNGAPWIFTIGASTIDRDFGAILKLGDGSITKGSSFYTNQNRSYHLSESKLIYESGDPACLRPFDPVIVNGTVLLCKNMSFSLIPVLLAAGARGVVVVSPNVPAMSFPTNLLPRVVLNAEDGAALVKYVSSTSNPVVEMQLGLTLLGVKPAPAIASFTSRGPYPPSQNILKPDVTAPGVNILAAWLPNTTIGDKYAIVSGTSMSCPHVAGLVVLMKAVHSEWSPAMIKSALMTTSYTHDNSNNAIIDIGFNGSAATPFDMGAGHVDPNKAMDPGLVYDLSVEDYVNYLCSLNYTTQQIQSITGAPVSCSSGLDLGSDGLNYPSFTAVFNKNATSSSSSTFKRTLTNVGDDISYYNAVVEVPKGLKVHVVPDVLEFKEKFEKVNFTVTVEVEEGVVSEFVLYGYLSWVDKKEHVVKSPVVALFQ